MMKLAVIGVGHLGKIHSRIYSEMKDVELVAVCDTRESEAKAVAEKFHTKAISNYHDLLGKVDAVSIATPTLIHYEIAKEFLQAGIHVLIEKPFTNSTQTAYELVELGKQKNAIIQVGHSERCNPIIIEFDKYNFVPLFIDAQRWSPYRFRSGDIGVVLDLMVHDIDLIQHWIRSDLQDVRAVGVNLFGPNEDIAHAYLTYQSGAVVSLTSSRAALTAHRKLRLFGKEGYVELDCGTSQGRIYKLRPEFNPIEMNLQQGIPEQFQGFNFEQIFYEKILSVEELSITKVEPLGMELTAFVQCIQNQSKPLVSGEEAAKTIETCEKIIHKIRKQIAEHSKN